VAGNGSWGFGGDGDQATSANLYTPYGVAVDSAGNLFIADRDNHRIRKVSSSGIITTVAGNGTSGYSGDGGPATSARLNEPIGVAIDSTGSLFIADMYNHRVRKMSRPNESIALALGAGAIGPSSTVGGNPDGQAGYVMVAVKSGPAPFGTAVLSLCGG
jgi:trimeric autotransporter adhesin